MLLFIFRTLKFGWQSFYRNFWLSLVTVTIVSLSLVSISALVLVTTISQQALNYVNNKVDLSVNITPKVTEDKIFALKSVLESYKEVKSVNYISADEALVRFKERHISNQAIGESLLILGSNPLGASLNVQAFRHEDYDSLISKIQESDFKDIIQLTRFEDNQLLIERISDVSNKVRQVGIVISLIFLIVALLVVFNTIRMNIYTHRQEIEIMRLVGATNPFIRSPFLVQSVLYAFFATLLTGFVVYISLRWLDNYLTDFIAGEDFDFLLNFKSSAVFIFTTEFAAVALLCMLASSIAMRRYLRV